MESIHDILNKIKSTKALPYIWVILACAVIGLTCFALGRASYKAQVATDGESARISIEYPPLVGSYDEMAGERDVVSSIGQNTDMQLVGSKNGTKYYKTTCAGVDRINEENKVYFSTIEEAEGAGYEPASNCF